MKKIILFLGICFPFITVNAQSPADRWYFGLYTGLDFSTGSPVFSPGGQINSSESGAVMCSASGNLLFYTDGITVWDRTHTIMNNGTGLAGGLSSTQPAVIVPLPGSSTLYYVFTNDEFCSANGFRYSIVDMSLNGGNGDVTTKNALILNNTTEKLTAVQEYGGTDYWIAVHECGTNAFYAYKLTSAGLQTAVISNVGIVHDNSQIQNSYGQMKFNGCGDKIAVAAGYLDTVQVLDFNSTTGVFSNPITIPMNDHIYGIEFSSNGKMLYVSCYDPSATLLQYDLTSGVQSTIIGTQTPISNTPDIYGLQIAPDGKIYVCKSFSTYLGVINAPNVAGVSCNYVDMGVNVDPSSNGLNSGLSLPGFVQSYFNNDACSSTAGINEITGTENLNVYPNPSENNFHLAISEEMDAVEIYDCSGKLTERFTGLKMGAVLAFGSGYANGMYTVKAIGEQKVMTSKIIKTGK